MNFLAYPEPKLCRFLGRESFKLSFGILFEGKTRKWQQLRGLQRLGHILEAWSEPQIHVGTTLFGRNHKNRGLVSEKLQLLVENSWLHEPSQAIIQSFSKNRVDQRLRTW